ncbi:MAG: tRNA 2-thiouridine(34) synthase MnmA [Bacteroidetes bacterium GWF2_49_14]|nr:MAG: tRNA 2-thiouridine(34) synthase MnmA [Bacteroidetes bacterium GWF2_49_14]
MKQRVVVGISGGVDSAVAAWLLKNQGYDVVGLFMRNWHDTTGLISAECSYEDDVLFAKMTANKIGIPFHEVDLSDQYRARVVDYLFREYEAGRTPNPDVLCNREIKFDAFVEEAIKLGAEKVATGHYARVNEADTPAGPVYRLLAGLDKNKDQSYFLCQLNQQQLSRAMFPLGELTKPEVRDIAREQGLANAERKDSQGICFVGKVDLPVFLQQKLEAKQGRIIEIPKKIFLPPVGSTVEELARPIELTPDMGVQIGKHQGAHFYTIGQRKGLNVGGKEEPLFILATDIVNNIIYVGQGQEHPLLFRQALLVKNPEIHWIRPDLAMVPGENRRTLARIRYRQELQSAEIIRKEEGIYIKFDIPQRAVVPGQFAVWHDGEELIGSGAISQ